MTRSVINDASARWRLTRRKYHETVVASRLSAPPAVRLLAEPPRCRLMLELASGDRRVREVVAAVGLVRRPPTVRSR